jgi:4,5-DOPA dioxygenase extradiol
MVSTTEATTTFTALTVPRAWLASDTFHSVSTTALPSIFIGHGSPMNTLEMNRFTETWQQLGMSLPRPQAILMISAHWFVHATAVTAMAQPRTIHDFSGFPDELFAYQYNAPGSPDLAHRVIELLTPMSVVADDSQWGLDHGTWSVLAHLYPSADIPVVQLSINASLPLHEHVTIGRRLAPLCDEGVLVLGSGNIVHNLSRINWTAGDTGYDWADRFDVHVAELINSDPSTVAQAVDHPDWAMAVPTPEHFLPLAYIAGIASQRGSSIKRFNQSRTMGSLSMTSYIAADS